MSFTATNIENSGLHFIWLTSKSPIIFLLTYFLDDFPFFVVYLDYFNKIVSSWREQQLILRIKIKCINWWQMKMFYFPKKSKFFLAEFEKANTLILRATEEFRPWFDTNIPNNVAMFLDCLKTVKFSIIFFIFFKNFNFIIKWAGNHQLTLF